MPGKWRILSIVLVLLTATLTAFFVDACPFCPPTDATLSEKLARSHAACVVKFLSSKNGDELSMQTSTFEVVKPLPDKNLYKKGSQIVINIGVTAQLGDQYLLMGQKADDDMEWDLPIPLDELGSIYNYLTKAPSLEVPKIERLAYFLKFLEHDNPVISNDAFSEFARAEFNDVAQLSANFSRINLRKWLEDPNPQLEVRQAFYGMVLGLCGNDNDAAFLERKLLAPIDPEKNRFSIGGIMGGYLLLRGPSGLQKLVGSKIDSLPRNLLAVDPQLADARLVDLSALRMTLSFLWDYRRSQFSEESLRAAMRRYLDRPEFAELAIVDLARWKDWASLDPLIAAYGHEPWDRKSAKAQIVAFALSCQKDGATESEKAQRFLESVDPALVESVRRSLGGKIPTP